jgi:hypothetical protein
MDVICRDSVPFSRPRPRLDLPPRSNLWQRVRFEICGIELVRRVVPEVEDAAGEICSQSPVGKALLTAMVGERITVEAPGGDVVVKVLAIYDDASIA